MRNLSGLWKMVVVLCCANEGGDEMSILIKLYNGEIYPADTAVPKTDNYKKAIHTQTGILETLISQLSDEQKEMIESYQSACADTNDLIQTEIFKEGFKLGALFMKEILDKEKDCLLENNE
jgi:hypothetical protein